MELDDRIKPALNMLTGKSLSAAEFQKLLYDYFDERGVLMDLRAHLRTQMISALKETTLGKVLVSKKAEISPKYQALNLLIAEYLLLSNYHYSLSVFSSEVCLGNVFLNNAIVAATKDANPETDKKVFKFCEGDLWDILETLGFNRLSHSAQDLSAKYKMQADDSLLHSIFRNISESKAKIVQSKTEIINKWLQRNERELDLMDLEGLINMLKSSGIDVEITLRIMEQIHVVVSNEVERLQRSNREELERYKRKLNLESSMKLDKYRQKMSKIEMGYKQEKQKLETDLFKAKQSLKESELVLQDKYKDVKSLHENIKKLERRLKSQEESLLLKEQSLYNRQEYLQTKEERIDKHLEELLLLSQKVEIKHSGTNVITENQNNQQKVEDPAKLEEENVILRKSSAILQDVIENLKGENQNYHMKVHELVLRTNTLLLQLESQNNQPSTNLGDIVQNCAFKAANPTLCQVINNRNKYSALPNYEGSGEEGSPKKSLTPRSFRNLHATRRKKHAKTTSLQYEFLNLPPPGTTTSSSEELPSPTDAILLEARNRLEVLEKESDAIDKHYDNLASNKQSQPEMVSSAAGLLHSFHTNVAMLKESISKMFFKNEPLPGTSQDFNNDSKETKILFEKTVENNFQTPLENPQGQVEVADEAAASGGFKSTILAESFEDCPSPESEVINLNGETISTIEVSSDEKYLFEYDC